VRVAFLLNKFPLLSETFVLNQITGLIDRGCRLDIYVRGPVVEEKTHSDVARYGLEAIDLLQDRLPDGRRAELLRRLLPTALSNRLLMQACLRKLRPGRVHEALIELHPAAEMARRGPYDVVHAHYGLNGNWAVRLRALGAFQAPIVTTFHDGFDLSTYVRLHGADVYRPAFEQAESVLPISDAVRRRLLELGCPADRAEVHRVGVDLRRFPDLPKRQREVGPLRVATVARLVEMKGVEHGVRAVARLASSGAPVDYRIAGDGPLRPALQALIQWLGVGASVRLLGWQSMAEVDRLLRESDVALAPSVTDNQGSQEGIPTALMEAMACRLPVVATGYSGVPELVRDGVDGYVTAERDEEAIAERLRRLAGDPSLRRRLGESGRRRVEQLHDIERLNDALLERYRALVAKAARR
jgi:colanic acid/amylovoran biosynthesis glycosyltransferase